MSALISDVLEGATTPGICNAAVNAGGKLLKVVEMQYRYGKTGGAGETKELVLCQNGMGEFHHVEQKAIDPRITALEEQLAALKQEVG